MWCMPTPPLGQKHELEVCMYVYLALKMGRNSMQDVKS